jgi:D-psicose/D-tagatose/L-ribulose 3-epimerase
MVYDLMVSELKAALPDLKIMIMEPFVLPGGGIGSDIKIWRSLLKKEPTQALLDADAAESVRYLRFAFGE